MKLELDGLTKEFGDFTAVNHIDLTMTNGVYGLLGVNGAGKTTLMRMLCTLLKPTSGTIYCNGKDIFSMDSEYRKLLGYLPQEFGFYPEFTVEDYLLYIAALKGIRPVVAKKRVKELIAKVGLSKVANKKMKKLKSDKFRTFSSLMNGFQSYIDLNTACNSRESRFVTSKLEEYIIADILQGEVAYEVGCDIINSKLFPNKKIEVKSTQKRIIPKQKMKNTYMSNRIIINNNFQSIDEDNISLNSDYIFFNFKSDFFTIYCKTEDIIPFITKYKNKLIYNTVGFNYIKHERINWPDSEKFSKNIILNLLKYGASPIPEEEYGKFNDYFKFIVNNPNINLYKEVKRLYGI